jgi:hypothetical protein
MSDFVSREGADTDSYAAYARRPSVIDLSTSPRALMADAKFRVGSGPNESERPAAVPVIPTEVVRENLRRVKAGATNTLVTILPDGKRMYREDRVVREADGAQDTVTHGQRSDRGEGTTESEKLLSQEGRIRVAGLLDSHARDGRGRFSN